MKSKEIHLNEDQLIRAVVDKDDLTGSELSHLFQCSVCRGKKLQLEEELNNLGRMVETLAPLSQRTIIPFFHESRNGGLTWRSVLATGFACFLLIIGVAWYASFTTTQDNMVARIIQGVEDDQQFVTEIIMPGEYVLPDSYLNISGEFYSSFDDEFLEFVVPLGINQSAV